MDPHRQRVGKETMQAPTEFYLTIVDVRSLAQLKLHLGVYSIPNICDAFVKLGHI